MVSFELSTTNILLTAAVVGLFIFFIALLMKLNPSNEMKEKPETEIEVKRPKPPQTLPIVPQSPQSQRIEVPKVTEKPLVAVSPTIGGAAGASNQTMHEPSAPTLNGSREIPKTEKTVPSAKTETVSFKGDCLHHFGYLRTFPKNSPIPDECFGCEKIVDCLVNKKSKGEKTKG